METVNNINGRTVWDRSFSFRKGFGENKHSKLQKLERWDTDLPNEIVDSFVVIWKQEGNAILGMLSF